MKHILNEHNIYQHIKKSQQLSARELCISMGVEPDKVTTRLARHHLETLVANRKLSKDKSKNVCYYYHSKNSTAIQEAKLRRWV